MHPPFDMFVGASGRSCAKAASGRDAKGGDDLLNLRDVPFACYPRLLHDHTRVLDRRPNVIQVACSTPKSQIGKALQHGIINDRFTVRVSTLNPGQYVTNIVCVGQMAMYGSGEGDLRLMGVPYEGSVV